MPEELNITRHRWITERQFGAVQTLWHRNRRIQYRLPQQISDTVTLRFSGRGRARNQQTGDLLLKIEVDRGRNVQKVLWLSEKDAHTGGRKRLAYRRQWWQKPQFVLEIPASSKEGDTVRIRGGGQKSPWRLRQPFGHRPAGDLLVKLRVFPDQITPYYQSSNTLQTEELALEGWVYRQYDQMLLKLSKRHLKQAPLAVVRITELFNAGGWRAIASALVRHLKLRHLKIHFKAVPGLKHPGECQKQLEVRLTVTRVTDYFIRIRSDVTNDPFLVTAILAHELCHVIESRYLAASENLVLAGAELLEMERRVDLLVFLHQLGEFQLRAARHSHQTVGYFNQPMFERIYVILQRKRAGS